MQNSLPIKTKIAAWWMIVVLSLPSLIFGIVGIFTFFVDFLGVPVASEPFAGDLRFDFLSIVGGILLYLGLIISSISLLRSKRLACKFSINILLIYLIIFGLGMWKYHRIEEVFGGFFLFGLYLIPLVLLLLDRKNFWKIAT